MQESEQQNELPLPGRRITKGVARIGNTVRRPTFTTPLPTNPTTNWLFHTRARGMSELTFNDLNLRDASVLQLRLSR